MTSTPIRTTRRTMDAESGSTFSSLVNFRDLGGHQTASGRRTRSGVFFCSDGVHRCTARDVEVLSNLGIGRVLDLRTVYERNHEGTFDPRHPSIDYRHVPLVDDVSGFGQLDAEEPMLTSYLDMIHDHPERMVAALRAVAETTKPVVFHCTAGKDRTGVLTALLLAVVGVNDASIVADYARSEAAMPQLVAWYVANRPAESDSVRDSDDAARRPTMDAKPEWMQQVLIDMRDCYGGVEQYFLESGASKATLAQLRYRLVG